MFRPVPASYRHVVVARLALGLAACGVTDCGQAPSARGLAAAAADGEVGAAGPGLARAAIDAHNLPPHCYRLDRHPGCGVEIPAVVERQVGHLPCRLPAFGVEGYVTRHDEPGIERYLMMGRGDYCANWAESTWSAEGLLNNVQSACEAEFLPLARSTYGADATVSCGGTYFVRCAFGGANTWLTYRVHLKMLTPVYRERSDDPSCPEAGQATYVEVAPPVYAACRHVLNGLDPDAKCGGR